MNKIDWKTFKSLPSIAQEIEIDRFKTFLEIEERLAKRKLLKARDTLNKMIAVHNQGYQLKFDLFKEGECNEQGELYYED